MAVGGEPERFYTRIMAAWTSWQGYFTKAIRQNTVLILLMDANFWTELNTLGEKLHLERLDCTTCACSSSALSLIVWQLLVLSSRYCRML